MEIQNTPQLNRILVIRRNRMGDMICTLPLLHALRRRYPKAHITVACDREGAAIAQACPAVDKVHVLIRGWLSLAINALRLRGYDAVIAAKGGFDKRLGMLVRLTDAPVRIGFHHAAGKRPSKLYSHPVHLPPADEHQVDTCLRLITPLGGEEKNIEFTLELPPEATAFARELLQERRTPHHRFVAVFSASSNRAHPLSETHNATLIHRLVKETHALVAISCLPTDAERARAHRLAKAAGGESVFVLETPTPLHLSAVIKESALVVTPEGGVGHLAAVMGTPALILWSEGPFEKWKTRADNHRYVRLDYRKRPPTLDDIWQSLRDMVPHAK